MSDSTSHMSPSKKPSAELQPPNQTPEDPGAHELDSSENEDDHFSDASEGEHRQDGGGGRYGFDSESPATGKDAPPTGRPGAPEIPLTVVEKVDPFTPSYGEVPGTVAYDIRQADAEPDVVMARDDEAGATRVSGDSTSETMPVPITKLTKADHSPAPAEVPGTEAHGKHKQDAEPDVVEQNKAPASEGTWTYQPTINAAAEWGDDNVWGGERRADEGQDDEHGGPDHAKGPGDDLGDVEGGGQDDDDFGDFDDGFTATDAPHVEQTVPTSSTLSSAVPLVVPPLDYDALDSPDAVFDATRLVMEEIFPTKDETKPPIPPAATADDSLFVTERSLSLWTQLVTAPPLPPPNWVRSRTRRLFLVSLGVPVDLDEILPSSKQKKLVLPSPHAADRRPESATTTVAGQQTGDGRSQGQPSGPAQRTTSGAKSKGSSLAPSLDVAAATRASGATEAALNNLTDEELREHVQQLEVLTTQSREALNFWLGRREDALGDKKAFEGVIENLVKHARRVRK